MGAKGSSPHSDLRVIKGISIICLLCVLFPLCDVFVTWDLAVDLRADADFGKTDFGHPYLTDFGQNLGGRLWPSRLWPKLVFSLWPSFSKKKGAPKGGAPKGGARNPEKWGPEG